MAKKRKVWFSASMLTNDYLKTEPTNPNSSEWRKHFNESKLLQLKTIQKQLEKIDCNKLNCIIRTFEGSGARYYIGIEIPGENVNKLNLYLDNDSYINNVFTQRLFTRLNNHPNNTLNPVNFTERIVEIENKLSAIGKEN